MAATFARLGRIEAIRQLFEGSGYAPFGEPLRFKASAGESTVSASRVMLEGVDFNLVYYPLQHLGYKSVLAVTGELLAAIARPHTLSMVLGVSAKLDFEQIKELWSGVVAAAREFGYKQLSLDLQPSRNGLCISASAAGRASETACGQRPEPQSKDLVCVSGSLGAAYFGMHLLERENARFEQGATSHEDLEKNKMLVAAYLKPELPAAVVDALEDAGIVPSLGYFVTRGLADTMLRIKRDTGLGVKVYADKIPFEGGSFALGKDINVDPVSAAMNGGEDCKLLFTIPIMQLENFRRDFQTFDIIGHLALPEAGAVLVTPEGAELPVSAQGWVKEEAE